MPCNSQQTYTYKYLINQAPLIQSTSCQKLAVKILFQVSSCLIFLRQLGQLLKQNLSQVSRELLRDLCQQRMLDFSTCVQFKVNRELKNPGVGKKKKTLNKIDIPSVLPGGKILARTQKGTQNLELNCLLPQTSGIFLNDVTIHTKGCSIRLQSADKIYRCAESHL